MPNLDLLRSSRTRVWIRTRDIVTSDPILTRTIQTFVVWDGSKIAQSPDLSSMMPLLRLTPTIGAQSWYSPDAMYGWLNVGILMSLQSRDAEDYLNLWEAVENSLYPYGDQARQNQIQQALRDAGAETGQWEFSVPPHDPDPRQNEDGIFNCVGSMRISVYRTINP